MRNSTFRPAWWLPGPHLPTMYGKFFRRIALAPTQRDQWETPDGDHLTLHQLAGEPGTPRLVILHGLEGGVHSVYTRGLLQQAHARGWGATLIIWRTCDVPVNRVRRAYHSGETTDTQFVIDRLVAEEPGRPIVMVGVSLGGNVLCKWLGERGAAVPPEVAAAAAVSVPFDLAAASRFIDTGFSRVYSRFFLKTLVAKTREKLPHFPGLVDEVRLEGLRTLWAFDDVVTGPVHGFADALDYYTRSSSLQFLGGIRRPTLLLSAVNDPFLPSRVLDEVRRVALSNPALTLEFTPTGGHAGFISGRHPWAAMYWMEQRVATWLADQAARITAPPVAAAGQPA